MRKKGYDPFPIIQHVHTYTHTHTVCDQCFLYSGIMLVLVDYTSVYVFQAVTELQQIDEFIYVIYIIQFSVDQVRNSKFTLSCRESDFTHTQPCSGVV